MTPRFPAATSDDVLRVARKLGFDFSRQAGTSHAIFKRASDKRRIVIPIHPGKTIKRKTLLSIIKDLGISQEEFRDLM